MAKRKRSLWDELREVGRRILKDIDDLLDTAARKPRQPARLPVPINKPGERARDR